MDNHDSIKPENLCHQASSDISGIIGIEPIPTESKSVVLPLHDTPLYRAFALDNQEFSF